MNIILIALGSEGDVLPLIHLGTALQRRGHHATVLASGYFEERIRRAGLEAVALGTAKEFLDLTGHPDVWHPRKGPKFIAERGVIPLIKPLYAFVSRLDPLNTVVVAPFIAFGARIASEKHGVPLATFYMQPAYLRSLTEPPVLAGVPIPAWSPRFVRKLLFREVDRVLDDLFLSSIRALRTEIGLPELPRHCYDWMNSPERILGLFPDWFAPPQPDWLPQIRLTGFLREERREGTAVQTALSEDLRHFLESSGAPPILFTAGTGMGQVDEGRRFFQESIDACGRLGRRGLFLTRFTRQIPDRLPEGIRHVEYLPFDDLLPQMGAIVHHGGIGTTASAIGAGIPQLVVPRAHDQPDNGARIERLGIGAALEFPSYRGDRAAAKMKPLLDSESVREACSAARRKLRDGRPAEVACNLIEALRRAGS